MSDEARVPSATDGFGASTPPRQERQEQRGSVRRRAGPARSAIGVLLLSAVLIALLAVLGDPPGGRGGSVDPAVPADDRPWSTDDVAADRGEGPPPAALLAAERFVAFPSGPTARALVEAVGGLEAMAVGRAEGPFDLVRFDPLDADRLIASMRSSYGRAENQDTNELWRVDRTGLTRTLLAADTPHDYAHFNRDGTITLWVHDDQGESFAPRTAVVLDGERRPTARTEPIFASRATAVGGTVFALTGDGDYYSNRDGYRQLVAAGAARRVLDSGEHYEWIDNPVPGLLVAYPRTPQATTAVWDAVTLLPLPEHPLAGRAHQRVAVSGDGRRAIGITFDDRMEQIDLATGRSLGVFGTVDPTGIDQPITVDRDATVAVTVDRSGSVALWWVGDNTPIARIDAAAAQPRWVSARYGARSASAVAPSAERVALRSSVDPRSPTSWTIVDLGFDRWIARACAMAGRALTVDERAELGLVRAPAACV